MLHSVGTVLRIQNIPFISLTCVSNSYIKTPHFNLPEFNSLDEFLHAGCLQFWLQKKLFMSGEINGSRTREGLGQVILAPPFPPVLWDVMCESTLNGGRSSSCCHLQRPSGRNYATERGVHQVTLICHPCSSHPSLRWEICRLKIVDCNKLLATLLGWCLRDETWGSQCLGE